MNSGLLSRSQGRKATLIAAAWLLLLSAVSAGEERTIHFQTDGKEQETKYLFDHKSRSFVLDGWGKPVRNLDHGGYAVWRFDVGGAEKASLSVNLLNSFALKVSADGENYEELAREAAKAGSNSGWKSADLTPFLPARWLYVRMDYGGPEEWNGGFGACIFEMKLTLEDDRTVSVARAARAETPPTIDGVLDDAAWKLAQPLATLSDRFCTRPVQRGVCFRLCYDAGHWYISARAVQPGAEEVVATNKKHDDPTYSEDAFEVFLLPPGEEDHYHLAVNMDGVVYDELNGEGGASWDSTCTIAVKRDTTMWAMEMAIPVSDLQTAPLVPGQLWRIGLFRNDFSQAQFVAWSSVAGGGYHQNDRYGKVTLVDTPGALVPAVNIGPLPQLVQGANAAKLLFSGLTPPSGYEITLDVYPLKSTRVSEEEQDLEQMNPCPGTPLAPPSPQGELDAEYTLDRFGVAHLTASLREKESDEVVSRAVTSVMLLKEDVRPVQMTLRQPYVTSEAELPVYLTLNLSADKLKGASVELAVLNGENKPLHASKTQAQRGNSEVVVPLGALPLGEYRVTVRVLTAAGEELAAEDRKLVKHEPFGTPRKVAIGDDGVCYVDGTPIMPLGFMLAPPVADVREAGYDVALFGGESLEGRGHFDEADKNGVLAMPHICKYLRGNNDYDGIRAVVSLRKTEPALFVWYLADEPEAYGDTPEVLEKAYRIIKEIDPFHPVAVLTNVPGMVSKYKNCADVVLTDPYPIPQHEISHVAEWTDITVRAAAKNGQAAWMTPQGFGWADLNPETNRPSPTREELSNMLYQCLIHGAKGIIWWPYGAPRKNYWPHFLKMGRECRAAEPWVLFGHDVEGMPAGTQVAGDIHWRAWEHNGRVFLMAANMARQARGVSIPVPKNATKIEFPFDKDMDTVHGLSGGEMPKELVLHLAPLQTMAVNFN